MARLHTVAQSIHRERSLRDAMLEMVFGEMEKRPSFLGDFRLLGSNFRGVQTVAAANEVPKKRQK